MIFRYTIDIIDSTKRCEGCKRFSDNLRMGYCEFCYGELALTGQLPQYDFPIGPEPEFWFKAELFLVPQLFYFHSGKEYCASCGSPAKAMTRYESLGKIRFCFCGSNCYLMFLLSKAQALPRPLWGGDLQDLETFFIRNGEPALSEVHSLGGEWLDFLEVPV